jgi:hypothetical protein
VGEGRSDGEHQTRVGRARLIFHNAPFREWRCAPRRVARRLKSERFRSTPTALSWPSGFRGGAHARPEATPVSHAARRRGGSVAARGAAFFRPSLHPVSESAYPTELFAGSPRGHCRPPALAMPITLMAAPSVITPRNANQLRKAKQLSGTATASNNSTFMAKCVCLWLRRPT